MIQAIRKKASRFFLQVKGTLITLQNYQSISVNVNKKIKLTHLKTRQSFRQRVLWSQTQQNFLKFKFKLDRKASWLDGQSRRWVTECDSCAGTEVERA